MALIVCQVLTLAQFGDYIWLRIASYGGFIHFKITGLGSFWLIAVVVLGLGVKIGHSCSGKPPHKNGKIECSRGEVRSEYGKAGE